MYFVNFAAMIRFLFLIVFICNYSMAQNLKKQITLGGGCFWCIEAAFEDAIGVESVISGFSGGEIKKPAYREVVNGKTKHAEVCQITYNPEVINLKNILEIFFLVHDPTTLNRQGNDIGRHYRSIILYHNDSELDLIQLEIDKYNKEYFENKIVTEVQKFKVFYPAENYHQEYYKNNADQPYCKLVIEPKLDNARKLLSKYY